MVLGIDLDEAVPHHSTFSQLRRRKFKDSRIFEDVFEEVVRQCIRLGFVKGEILAADSTHVKANVNDTKTEFIEVTKAPSAYMQIARPSGSSGRANRPITRAKRRESPTENQHHRP